MNWKVLITIGILVVVVLGFLFVSNMTGSVTNGNGEEIVESEAFRISDFGNVVNETEDLNGAQDSSGQG